ncbi:porin family protein [Flavisolibacter tropicus]|uniref:porin family protein n=1 Tax=Flavisolibacter tropicus TaxID=1492898 RepID=UPI001314EBB4|nr:porin family protein [Flavisolibacter tropicus]
MKTKLSVLFACVIFMNAAKAQFDVGIKAGANINKVEGKTFKDEFNYGYLLGGFARIGLGSKLGIQPEVLFSQYQTKTSSNPSDIWADAGSDITNKKVKLNYLSIPIMLNYKLAGNFLALQAGPQFGILLNNDETLVKMVKMHLSLVTSLLQLVHRLKY